MARRAPLRADLVPVLMLLAVTTNFHSNLRRDPSAII